MCLSFAFCLRCIFLKEPQAKQDSDKIVFDNTNPSDLSLDNTSPNPAHDNTSRAEYFCHGPVFWFCIGDVATILTQATASSYQFMALCVSADC